MAQVTNVTLVDDLDGSAADDTVAFGLDGRFFEIDLNAEHASQLRDAIAPFVAAARRTGAGPTRKTSKQAASNSSMKSREENIAIRQWATEKGFEISTRGRLSAAVLSAYDNRDSTPTPEPQSAPTQVPAVEAEEKPKRRTRKKAAATAA